ncbi:FHA domain-containing protein [Nostocaceae cyanobacterium CENA357]|uniref:FHA domain-containing protein n=1 Tax=Atlanticothrix silvestris CENA357 TaxID=1725252 RepID=A0A8J7HEG8_9CYAN|nr:FHA domain-containing protein [Atlanticothrix silvestris]MBH8553514.1 FHA domain-containing protein [Atlanticothrix silvestris CENA357]
MQNLNELNTTGLSVELLHVQTNISFELPPNLAVVHIGKPNDQSPPDIDLTNLPNADVISRIHAQIQVEENNYFIEDLGSSNSTFLNNVKLEPRTPYQLKLGDKIDLGQGGKVTFIFQNQQEYPHNFIPAANPTRFQSPSTKNNRQATVDRPTKLVGLALMITGVVILTANIQVGIFFRIPGILLCCAGAFVLFQRRVNQNLGWLLIALGIAVITFTGNIFASVNLLVILASSILFLIGYQLFTTGKILDYDLRSIKALIKK